MCKLLLMLLLLMLPMASANAELYPAYDNATELWGYIDETGAWAIAPQYHWAEQFHGGCAIVDMNPEEFGWPGKQGIIDETGAYLLEPEYFVYDYMNEGAGDIYLVDGVAEGEETAMGWFNIPNRYFSGMKWAECYVAQATLYVLVSDEKGCIGLADRATGEVVLPLVYSYAGLYDDSIENSFVVGCRADTGEVELVEIGVGKVELPEGTYLESGTVISEGLVAFARESDGLMGYLNTSGEIVIPAQFLGVDAFWDGYANVRLSEDEVGVIDKTGRVMLRCEGERAQGLYQGMVAGMMFLQWDDHTWGLAKPDGTEIGRIHMEMCNNTWLYEFSSDGPLWLWCEKPGWQYAWVLVSRTGELMQTPDWTPSGTSLYSADSQGWQAVGNSEGLWGYVDAYGSEVIPFRYSWAACFQGPLAHVEWPDGREGYIDRSGNPVYAWTAK